MSTSENYLQGLLREGPADWGAAIREIHAEYGKKAAGLLGAAMGKSTRTGERWIAKAEGKINPKTGRPSQASEPKPMAQVGVVDFAKRIYAARKLRSASVVHAGDVTVTYEGQVDPRPRHIGDLPAVGVLRQALDVAADQVMAGLLTEAADRIDQGVLDAYGIPERLLEVEDYRDGFGID